MDHNNEIEAHRVSSIETLWGTRIPERFSLLMVEEYIQNHEQELKTTHSTLVGLNKTGHSFFESRNKGKKRFTVLVRDEMEIYILEIENKLRNEHSVEVADQLIRSKDLVKVFL